MALPFFFTPRTALRKDLAVLIFSILCITQGFCQGIESYSDTSLYLIKIKGSTKFPGTIIAQDSARVFVLFAGKDTLVFDREKLKGIEPVEKALIRNNEYWFRNPGATRYLMGQNAIPLRPGEGYYQNTYLVLNSLNAGITDFLSIGGGIELVSLIAYRDPIYFLTAKAAMPVARNFYTGGVIMYGNMANQEDFRGIGIGYGLATYGTSHSNISIGLGHGFADGSAFDLPLITISGMARAGPWFSFVTENWILPIDGNYYEGIVSGAIRIMSERVTLDAGLLSAISILQNGDLGIPYLALALKF